MRGRNDAGVVGAVSRPINVDDDFADTRKERRGRKPFWMRRHCSCPDCGFVINEGNAGAAFDRHGNFDCPRCNVHFSAQDFEAESAFKHGKDHQSQTD